MAIAVMSIVILGGGALMVFFAIRWHLRTTREQRAALAALGEQHGMLHEYDAQKLDGHVLDLGFEVFDIGFGRRLIEQRLWSDGEVDTAFQLRGVGTGNNPGVEFSCAVVGLSDTAPDVVVTAQGAVRQSLQKLRRQAEGLAVPGLGERFHIAADDESAAQALLAGDVTRWLDQNADFLLAHHARIECRGQRLLTRLDHGSAERSMVAMECSRQLAAIIDSAQQPGGC